MSLVSDFLDFAYFGLHAPVWLLQRYVVVYGYRYSFTSFRYELPLQLYELPPVWLLQNVVRDLLESSCSVSRVCACVGCACWCVFLCVCASVYVCVCVCVCVCVQTRRHTHTYMCTHTHTPSGVLHFFFGEALAHHLM